MARQRPDHPRRPSKPRPVQSTRVRQESVRWVSVDEDHADQRVDNFLLVHCKGVPKSIIYRIIRKGEVRVNKGRVKPDTRLKLGDQVRIPPLVMKSTPTKAVPGKRVQSVMEKAIVFEDEQMLVVNKPSGIAVHGGSGVDFGLIEVLRAARPKVKFLELVHRLDRDTSGLVMIAKKRSSLRNLQEQLKNKTMMKTYHALVCGAWSSEVEQVDQPLLRFELKNGERRVRVDEAGKPSLTRFRLVKMFEGYSLVEARPITGRTHQIRVHCAFAGHPIAGDEKYLDDAGQVAFEKLGGKRLMLHARALEFRHPDTERTMCLEAEYDDAFHETLARLEARQR